MFDGLNLGLAINIADGASVNAQKISSSIEKLISLSNQLGKDAKKDSSGVDALANSFNNANRHAHTGAGGVRAFGTSLERLEPRLISVRSGIIRLFPYVSVLGGLYALKRGFDDTMTTFSEYEYAMKNMQAATGYGVGEMNMLDRQFRELAVSGRFTAKEIAEAGYDLTTTIEIEANKVKDLTQSVLSYATATQYSVKESGLDMLSLLSKLNRPLSDSTILFDQMAKATNITSLTAQRLSEMLKITGTEALGMKVPFDQLLALMGRTDLYYKGGEGGTRLRMMFQMLAQSTKIHGDILQKYGLSMRDVDIKSRGLLNVLGKLKGMEYGDLSRLVGGYSAGLVMRLSADTKYIAEMQAKLTEDASRGTTATMYDVQIKSLDGRRKQLKNIVTEMQLTLADSAKQPYANFLGKIAGFITEITNKMHLNSGVLKTIFETIFGWANGIGKMIAGHIRSILGWTGLLADTQEESQRLMRNNLMPFIVFVEVMGLRVWNFIKGFAQGFWDGAKLVWKAVSTIGGWISDLLGWILPLGDQFSSLGYVLGAAIPLLWGFSKAAALLRFILPALGIELGGVSVLTTLWNTILLANPILTVGAAILAVGFVMEKHRSQIQEWIDSLPGWAQPVATAVRDILDIGNYFGSDQSLLMKTWNNLSSFVFKGVVFIAEQIDALFRLMPKSIRVFLGVDDEGLADKLKFWNNGTVAGQVPKGESAVQYNNPKSAALAGAMLTDKDAIKSGALSNKTASMYANFGNATGKTNWGMPDAPKARPKLPETPTTPEKSAKKESASPATTVATKKDQATKHPGAPSVTLSPRIIVPRGEVPPPRVMPNATVDQVDTEEVPEMPELRVPALTAPVVRVEKVPPVHVGISPIKPVHVVAPKIPNVGVVPMKPVHLVAPKIPALSVSPTSPLKVEVPKLPEVSVQSLGPVKVEVPEVSPVRLLAPMLGPLKADVPSLKVEPMPNVTVGVSNVGPLKVETPKIPALGSVQVKVPELTPLQMLAPSIAPVKVDTVGAAVGVSIPDSASIPLRQSVVQGIVPKVAEKQQKLESYDFAAVRPNLSPATSLANNLGGQVKVMGVGPHDFGKQVRKDVVNVMSPEELDKLGFSDDLLSEYQGQASEMMQGYKTTADSMMSKLAKGQETPSAARTVSPQTINQEFKFGDINIDSKGGDPEKIARELVPYIRKVVREEMKR